MHLPRAGLVVVAALVLVAGGLILAGLKGETPGVTVTAEVKVTLPCGETK